MVKKIAVVDAVIGSRLRITLLKFVGEKYLVTHCCKDYWKLYIYVFSYAKIQIIVFRKKYLTVRVITDKHECRNTVAT